MDQIVRQMTSLATDSKILLAFGATLALFLAILGVYKLGNYLNWLLISAKYEHPSTTSALDHLNICADQFNSPHDSGYASEGSDSDQEDDPELSSLRKAIKMCEDQPKTPRGDREVAFQVFADFARASTGSKKEAHGLGVSLNEREQDSGR